MCCHVLPDVDHVVLEFYRASLHYIPCGELWNRTRGDWFANLNAPCRKATLQLILQISAIVHYQSDTVFHPCVKPPPQHSQNHKPIKQTNKKLRCGNRKGLLGRTDQTHHRMGPKTMDSTPPSNRKTQSDIQRWRLQTVRMKQITRRIYVSPNNALRSSRAGP